MKSTFSLFEMDELLRGAGAERVSEEASRKLAEVLEDNARQLLLKASVCANHAKRKQIMRKDLLLASKLTKLEEKNEKNHD